ncbi:hypothetical protein CSIM01_12235 [Colletotrichum simmondsii]|uniref:Rhodanese domain-containing protein n=1 Tax=Colletotrichum simmondsii TaxID=703756 RepID=A0A135TVU2_9PEZI|nr:hypothetical protein CSIM01_12235 [Colletotrichum simmondsii]
MATIGTLQRISAAKLSALLLAEQAAGTSSVAVVDVRDDDYLGGHIKGCINMPSRSLDATMPTLMRRLEGKKTVVFHCALSQQRGPSAALRYLRERDQNLASTTTTTTTTTTDSAEDSASAEPQTVYVLDRGFVGWQEKYGEDERLTEGYSKELWKDGYWMQKIVMPDGPMGTCSAFRVRLHIQWLAMPCYSFNVDVYPEYQNSSSSKSRGNVGRVTRLVQVVLLSHSHRMKEVVAMYTSGEIALIIIGSFAILTSVLWTAFMAHATVLWDQESRSENNKLSSSEFAAACCLKSFGLLILTPPILAYSIVVLCLAIAAIVPGFLFRACVEPVCGPFACSKTANVADILGIAFHPCLYVLHYWKVYSMCLVGDDWEEPASAKAPMPKI